MPRPKKKLSAVPIKCKDQARHATVPIKCPDQARHATVLIKCPDQARHATVPIKTVLLRTQRFDLLLIRGVIEVDLSWPSFQYIKASPLIENTVYCHNTSFNHFTGVLMWKFQVPISSAHLANMPRHQRIGVCDDMRLWWQCVTTWDYDDSVW